MKLTAMKVNELLDVSCDNVLDGAVDPVASLVGRPADVHFSSIPLMLNEDALFFHHCFHDLNVLMFIFHPSP